MVGNLLAVLSWTFLTAPIATRARLTLYYQLEKICGRGLVTLYNLANGVMFCFLAGAMITVSATAVGVWIKFPMPALTDVYPNSVGWVVAVARARGAFITIVAVYGYEFVARVANIAAPWMTLVFIAFGLVALRQFDVTTRGPLARSVERWRKRHLEGRRSAAGQVKFTFWHVMFFAWFCNMAMHIGMSDLSIFRFARKSGTASPRRPACSSATTSPGSRPRILYALQLHEDPSEHRRCCPGPLAYAPAASPA